jgi:hypothetical protein
VTLLDDRVAAEAAQRLRFIIVYTLPRRMREGDKMFYSAGHSFFWGADNELGGFKHLGDDSHCSFR